MKRRTNQRMAILQVIQGAERPLTVQEVLERSQKIAPRLHRATVYRNLRSLVESGQVRRVSYPELTGLYESALKDHHHHFHCQRCQRLFEVPGCAVDLSASTPPGFQIYEHELLLSGRCAECGSLT